MCHEGGQAGVSVPCCAYTTAERTVSERCVRINKSAVVCGEPRGINWLFLPQREVRVFNTHRRGAQLTLH